MTDLRKAAEDALKLLEKWAVMIDAEWGSCRDLEEIEQDGDLSEKILNLRAALSKVATKQEWVGLTDEEFNDCFVNGDPCENLAEPEAWAVMKEVEAKLKEKNSG